MSSITKFSTSITMNSLEIADLLNCRHDNVKKSIDRLADKGVIKLPPLQGIKTATKPAMVYVFDTESKRDTYVVVAQLSPEFTAKIVDRWQELEGNNVPRTPAEQLLYNAQMLVEHERKIADLEESQDAVKSQVRALVEGENYFTVVGYCNKNKIKVDSKAAQRIGKSAAKICRENEWETGTANHPLFGEVKTYPEEAIEEAIKH